MVKTFNNNICKRIIYNAICGRYRHCAYMLYNYRNEIMPELYRRVLSYTFLHLGADRFFCMLTDPSIDTIVRQYFIHLDIDLTINWKGGVYNEKKKKTRKA